MKLQKFSKCIISTILGLSFASAAIAADKKDGAQSLVDKVTQGQLSTIKTFDGPGNLEGFLLKPEQGLPIIMYADKDAKYMVYGNLIGPDGQSITEQDNSKYVTPYVSQLIETNLATASSFAQGSDKAKYQMYVMADPNCSACHYFYKIAEPLIDKGDLQVHWILVSFLKPDSPNKAASIIIDEDPSKAMKANEEKFVDEEEEGGAKNLDPIPKDVQAKIDANMAFMSNSGLSKTPTLIFWNKDGELQFIEGVPRDFDKFLADNVPVVKTADS